MDQITDTIWLGSKHSVNVGTLRGAGVTAILNVAADLQNRLGWDDGFTLAQCGLWDGPGNPLSSYYSAVFQLMRLQQLRHKVLVHCHEGVSRSPFIVICYLRTQQERPFEELEAFVRSRRSKINIAPVHKERYLLLEPNLRLLEEWGR